MIILLISIVSVAIYLGIGYRAAVWNIPRVSPRLESRWNDRTADIKRRQQFYSMLLFWVIRMPFAIDTGPATKALEKHDPEFIKRRITKQKEELAEAKRQSDFMQELITLQKDYPRGYDRLLAYFDDDIDSIPRNRIWLDDYRCNSDKAKEIA